MKKVLLVAVMAVFMVCANAQEINAVKVNYEYCEIVGSKPFMASKIKISIDYGNNGETESVEYKSMVETLNAMVQKGWVLDKAYTAPTNNGNNMTYCWVLKREVKK